MILKNLITGQETTTQLSSVSSLITDIDDYVKRVSNNGSELASALNNDPIQL